MARAKRSRTKKVTIPKRQAMRPELTRHWRLGSVLTVSVLALALAPKSAAAAAVFKAQAKPQLNVVDIGDLYSYGYATSSQCGAVTGPVS